MNMLSLAFVGDAVFTLFVRERLARNHDNKAGGLHKLANKYVKATSQAQIFDHLEVFLYEKEKEIARRARNAHNNTKAKNASLADYKKATAFEALLGYHLLSEDVERLNELLEIAVDFIEKGEN